MNGTYDVIVAGAGTAGLPTAISAAERGARVALIEKTGEVGGSLHVTAGQMSAAGTKLQARRGIEDTPDSHFEDAMRISKRTADADLVRLAVDLAPGTVDWLTDQGFEFDPVCPEIFFGHEAYSVARTYWGVGGGRTILKFLRPLLDAAIATGRLDLRLDTELTAIQRGENGHITGVEVRGPDGPPETLPAPNLVMTTGGYGANAGLFAEWTQGFPLFSAARESSTGEGIVLGQQAGAARRNAEKFLPTFGGIAIAGRPGRIDFDDLPNLTPQLRPPWEIYVNLKGERFVAEDNPSVDAREHALIAQPELTFWIVYDETARTSSEPFLGGWLTDETAWSGDAVMQAFDDHASFQRADSIAALAKACGLDAEALEQTVAAYNAGVKSGSDALGRAHLPAPLAAAPYYAIMAHGVVLKTAGGLTVDTRLRVIGEDGNPIPGLYAAGEAIGGATLSGQSFVGGMSVTPALGFGRLLGRQILEW